MAKKKQHEEEHENHERWLLTYADMITLLMTLFIVLFAMSNIDATKFKALADSLAGKEPSPSVLDGQPALLDGAAMGVLDTSRETSSPEFDLPDATGASAAASAATNPVADSSAAQSALQHQHQKEAAEKREADNLEQVKQEIQASLSAAGLAEAVKFTKDKKGLTISIITDQVLFDPGQATIKPESYSILQAIGTPLASTPNDIAVEGHTDNVPISTPQFPSNWELSTARATSVLRHLVEQEGVAPNRIGATGFGQERPAVPNDSDAHRSQNRRVEVVVLSNIQD